MKTKIIAVVIALSIIAGGATWAILLNRNTQKDNYFPERSDEELIKVFIENKKSFQIVAEYFKQQDEGFDIDLSAQNINKNEELNIFPEEVSHALQNLQGLNPAIRLVYVGSQGVQFECGFVGKNHRGSYLYAPQEFEDHSGFRRKISNDWYLVVVPNT